MRKKDRPKKLRYNLVPAKPSLRDYIIYFQKCPICGGSLQIRPAAGICGKWDEKTFTQVVICENYESGCDTYTAYYEYAAKPPLPAGRELRRMRWQAHQVFDLLWKKGAAFNRTEAYRYIGEKIGIPGDIHIGQLNDTQCRSFLMESLRLLDHTRLCQTVPDEIVRIALEYDYCISRTS